MAMAGAHNWCQPTIEGMADGIVDQRLAVVSSPSLPSSSSDKWVATWVVSARFLGGQRTDPFACCP